MQQRGRSGHRSHQVLTRPNSSALARRRTKGQFFARECAAAEANVTAGADEGMVRMWDLQIDARTSLVRRAPHMDFQQSTPSRSREHSSRRKRRPLYLRRAYCQSKTSPRRRVQSTHWQRQSSCTQLDRCRQLPRVCRVTRIL